MEPAAQLRVFLFLNLEAMGRATCIGSATQAQGYFGKTILSLGWLGKKLSALSGFRQM